jgi:hypothetical protein
MTASPLSVQGKFISWRLHLIVAIVVTTFLFFIDEGYYNFNWTKTLSNWFFFLAYTFFIFLGQTITYRYILKRFKGESKGVLTSLIGVPLGLFTLIAILFSMATLFAE